MQHHQDLASRSWRWQRPRVTRRKRGLFGGTAVTPALGWGRQPPSPQPPSRRDPRVLVVGSVLGGVRRSKRKNDAASLSRGFRGGGVFYTSLCCWDHWKPLHCPHWIWLLPSNSHLWARRAACSAQRSVPGALFAREGSLDGWAGGVIDVCTDMNTRTPTAAMFSVAAGAGEGKKILKNAGEIKSLQRRLKPSLVC